MSWKAVLMKDKFKQPIKLVNAWYCENSLLINPDKTKVLAVGVSQGSAETAIIQKNIPWQRNISRARCWRFKCSAPWKPLSQWAYHKDCFCLFKPKQKNLSERKMLLLLKVCMCVWCLYIICIIDRAAKLYVSYIFLLVQVSSVV